MTQATSSRPILVVDDEPVIAELVREVLCRFGYQVDVVHDIQAARERLSATSYALCISDFLLPDETGLDLARWIRERGAGPAVLLMTAYLEPELEEQVKGESVIVGVVRKPMDVFQLKAQVDELVQQAPPEEAC